MDTPETCTNCGAILDPEYEEVVTCSNCGQKFCEECCVDKIILRNCDIHNQIVCMECMGTNGNSDFDICCSCIERLVAGADRVKEVKKGLIEAFDIMDGIVSQSGVIASQIDPILFQKEFIFFANRLGVLNGVLKSISNHLKN